MVHRKVRKRHTVSGVAFAIFSAATIVCARGLFAQRAVATHDASNARRASEMLLARHVTVTLDQVSIQTAIDSVAQLAQAFVQYRGHMLDAYTQLIRLHVTDVPLGVVLERILNGTELHVVPDGQGNLVIPPLGDSTRVDSLPSVGTVTGHVIDSATGRGLSGVAIKVIGTKISTITQDSGRFTIRSLTTGQHIVMAKLFGYRPGEGDVDVIATQTTIIRIKLESVPTVLSGVVTTATGLQRKIALGNDITSLNVDSLMQVAPITSVTDLLETRVPGLTVTHSSGVPGDPSRLRLRGSGSVMLNNDPIVIVDGVRIYANQSDLRNENIAPNAIGGSNQVAQGSAVYPGFSSYAAPSPLDQIDPNNIATIDVFKGPSASALYGSDAATGVIVITTKHGRAGPTSWSVQVGQGVNWLPGSWPTNLWRFDVVGFNDTTPCSWFVLQCTATTTVPFQALNDPRFSLLAHGSDQIANLTVSGGVPVLQYSLTGSVSTDVGNLKLPNIVQQHYQASFGPVPRWMVRPDNYRTWSVSGALTAQPAPQLRVAITSQLFHSDQQRSSLERAIEQLEGEYVTEDGVIDQTCANHFDISGCLTSFSNNPLIALYDERATAGALTENNGSTIDWQPRPWLPLTMVAGLSTAQTTDQTYIPYGQGVGPGGTGAGSYGLGRGTTQNQTLSTRTAIPLLRQHVTVAVGGNVYAQSTADFTAYTNQLAPGVTVPTSFPTTGTAQTTFGQATSASTTYGWYLEPRLNVSSRFFAAPGFRLDGGSGGTHATTSGGAAGGLSAFPKLDFSYIAVDRQDGHPAWGVITLLRPRLAFGFAGTQPAPADRLRLFNSNQAVTVAPIAEGTTIPITVLNTIGNTQLRPERTRELEGGFDATLWRGRLTLTYTQYDKTTQDAILSIPIAPSIVGNGGSNGSIAGQINGVGVANSYEKNIGVVRNTGTELSLTAQVIQRRALEWTIGANVSHNNSLLVRLNPGQPPFCLAGDFHLGGSCLAAGYPLFGEWVPPLVGFADANHNGIIEASEIRVADSAVYIGQPVPKYQINATSDLALFNGRLSVHGTFSYQNGLTQNNASALTSGAYLLAGNAPGTSLASQAAVFAGLCSGGGGGPSNCAGATNIGLIQTVNTFRFSDLSINYAVPTVVSTAFRVPRMSVALQGSNLALHTNYRGKDPDVNAFSNVTAGEQTIDLGQLPEPRTWWLKVSLGN